jgi:nicotinate-nucleotide pyrophosphorylase (carboxylating)
MDIKTLIEAALLEDIGDGDHTALAIFPPDTRGDAKLLIKEDGILCGIPVVQELYQQYDPSLEVSILMNDGAAVSKGDIAYKVSGSILSILSTERIALNFLQRLSGIATATHRVVSSLEGTGTQLLDTRKTTPAFRELEKYAVRTGGGINHRIGLYDMILIKNNHVDFVGNFGEAIRQVHAYLKKTGRKLKIEVEVRDFYELMSAIEIGGIDRIMLDNFTPEDLKDAITIVNGRYETEASGGITPENARQYAETGVNFLSMGALTHSVKSLDMSLRARHKYSMLE